MATAPKKKSPPAPAKKSEAAAPGKKGKAAPATADEDEDEDEDEAPAPAPTKKGKKAAAPAPEPDEDDEDDEDAEEGDEDEDEDEDEDAEEGAGTAFEQVMAALGDDFKPQGKKEADEAFITRIVTALNELPDDAYASMGEDGDAWFQATAKALNKKKPIPPLPGFNDAEADEEAAPAPKKGAKAAKPADAPKQEKGAGLKRWREEQEKLRAEGKLPPKKEKKPKGPKKERGTGASFSIRMEVAADPSASVEEIRKRLEAKGVKINEGGTLGSTRASTLATIRALTKLGKLKGTTAEAAPEPDDEDEEEEAPAPAPKKKAKK